MKKRQGLRGGAKGVLLAGAAMVSCGVANAATPAQAQTARQYSVPSSDAGDAVQAVAQQSGLQVIAPNADLRGVRTKAINGNFTAIEALRRMFADTGLEVIESGDGTVTIRRGAISQADNDATPPASDVVVTGSRIRRTGFDTVQAATVTDAAEIERRGYTNVIQALQDTPGFAPASNSPLQSTQSNLAIGQSFSNFFGLGSQRTLTLVNGRRFVSSNTASGAGGVGEAGSQVDVNLIPVKLTERIETVAIGGAPIYGSDAIAGTVNFILRRDFSGLELDAQASVSERGDAANQTVQALFGRNFLDGRGNIVVSAEYSRQEGMKQTNRFPQTLALAPSGDTDRTNGISAQTIIDQRIAVVTEGGLPYRAGAIPTDATYFTLDGRSVAAGGTRVQFGPDGSLVPFNLGARFIGDSGGAFRSGGDGVNPADTRLLLAPNERMVFNLLSNFDVTPGINLFFEGSYARTSGTKLSDLFQFASAGLGGPLLTIAADNPFLTSQARSVLAANGITGSQTFVLGRNLNDIADRRPAKTVLEVYQIAAGARGGFTLGGERWDWDVSYNFGRSENVSEFNQINRTRFLAAIDVVSVNGTPQCRSGAGCIPLNIFGQNAFTSAAGAAVIDVGVGTSINTLEEIQANIGGKLPFGLVEPISFSLGATRRKETGEFIGNDIINGGLTLLGGASAFPDAPRRGFSTKEVYGEALVPLINDALDLPLVRSAEIEGAFRYVDHSVAGGDTTWSVGGRLNPRLGRISEGLVLRGVYTRAIRAPSVRELFLNTTPTAGAANDVCAPSRINSGPNPTVRATNCRAALAAVGVSDPATFAPTTNGLSPLGTVGGNPNLDNERANSWSVGFVFQPAIIPRLRVSMDYNHIVVTGAIAQFTLGSAQSACYDSPNYPNEGACDAFRRYTAAEAAQVTRTTRVAGDIAEGYLQSFFNSSRIEFSGILGEIDYRLPFGDVVSTGRSGEIRLGLKAFYVDKFLSQASGAAVPVDAAGTVSAPQVRLNGRVGVALDPVDLDVQVLWNSRTVGSRTLTFEDTPINDFDAYTLVNTTLGIKAGDRMRLQFIVRNLLDRKIPFAAEVGRNYGVFDPIGRTFTAAASVKF